jgi:hypothetical protein
MGRPGSEWVAVAWFSDQGRASNVADYLEASGVTARTHAEASRGVGNAPVFVQARQLDLARKALLRLKTREFAADAEEGTADAIGLNLIEDMAAAPDYQPPSALARWAPLVLVPVGIILVYLFTSLVASVIFKDHPPDPVDWEARAVGG